MIPGLPVPEQQAGRVWHNPFALLSDAGIERARAEGLIVIEPFEPKHLGPNSYDVRLGEWFYREQHSLTRQPVYNPYDQAAVARVWGQPERAQTYAKLCEHGLLPADMVGFVPTDLIVLLAPGETILAHTVEFVGGRRHPSGHGVVPHMHARSSVGRSLLSVCKCAGWGDVGFFGRWTMEMTSFSQYHWIPLLVGSRVAQIAFTAIENVDKDYGQVGHYQAGTDLNELIAKWQPDLMLPRFNP
jgi:dCTP deaminase